MSNVDIKIHNPKIAIGNNSKPAASKNIDTKQYIPEPYREVATGMEEQFANFMIAEMEKSVGNLPTDTAGDYYATLMRSKRAEMMAKKESLGLQNVILDQIYPEAQRTKEAYDAYQKMVAMNNFSRKKIEIHDQPKQDIQMVRKTSAKELTNE